MKLSRAARRFPLGPSGGRAAPWLASPRPRSRTAATAGIPRSNVNPNRGERPALALRGPFFATKGGRTARTASRPPSPAFKSKRAKASGALIGREGRWLKLGPALRRREGEGDGVVKQQKVKLPMRGCERTDQRGQPPNSDGLGDWLH